MLRDRPGRELLVYLDADRLRVLSVLSLFNNELPVPRGSDRFLHRELHLRFRRRLQSLGSRPRP
jgi:hypothetical protein